MTLIPIGRFSKMTRLSVKALRLYDENGMLRPALVDASTGYRYYQLDQAARAELIRTLRLVEMPLAEIQIILETDDNGKITEQLLAHKDRLAKRLDMQQRMLSYLETIIRQKEQPVTHEVELAQEEPLLVAAVKIHTSQEKIASDISAGFERLMRGLNRSDVSASGVPMILYHHVIDEESDGDIEICAPVASAFLGNEDVGGRELEGGPVATTVHQGPYEGLTAAYHSLTDWISKNGYEIAGPPREIYLSDPKTTAEEDLLTRVSFPVCADNKGERS